MRLALAWLTIGIVMSLDMNGLQTRTGASLESAATANPAPVDQVAAEADEASELSAFAGQIANVGKADRLFPIRDQDFTTSDDGDAPNTDAVAAPDVPAELSTPEFCEALAQAATESDIPVAFFARLIWQESKFKHDATSPVGAQGVAQFMPRTAAEMGLDDPFDPRKALPASARFLRRLHDQFGNLGLAAAAYNAGSGRIQNWLARRGPLPDETRNYVRKVTGNAAEKWTAEKQMVALQVDLPREAPCEGIGGLSRARDVESTRVALTPIISAVIRKAAEDAARAAAAAKERLRIALLKSKKATRLALAKTIEKTAEKASEKDLEAADTDTKTVRKTVIINVSATKPVTVKTAALGRRKSQETRRVKLASAKD